MSSATNDTTTYIDRPTGRIAYDLIGDGPPVVVEFVGRITLPVA